MGKPAAGCIGGQRLGACRREPRGLGHSGAGPTAPDGPHPLAHARPGNAHLAPAPDVDAAALPAHGHALVHGDVPTQRHATCLSHAGTQHTPACRANGDTGDSAHGDVPVYALAFSDPGQTLGNAHDSSVTDSYSSGTDGHVHPAGCYCHGDVSQRAVRGTSFHRYPRASHAVTAFWSLQTLPALAYPGPAVAACAASSGLVGLAEEPLSAGW